MALTSSTGLETAAPKCGYPDTTRERRHSAWQTISKRCDQELTESSDTFGNAVKGHKALEKRRHLVQRHHIRSIRWRIVRVLMGLDEHACHAHRHCRACQSFDEPPDRHRANRPARRAAVPNEWRRKSPAPRFRPSIGNARMSETSVLYPKETPRSVTITFGLPDPVIFATTFFMSQGARNWPFFTFTTLPVLAAAMSKSVWRERNAGICRISTCGATRAHCSSLWMSVRTGRPSFSRSSSNIGMAASRPAPRLPPSEVRFALSKLDLYTSRCRARSRFPSAAQRYPVHAAATQAGRVPRSALAARRCRRRRCRL